MHCFFSFASSAALIAVVSGCAANDRPPGASTDTALPSAKVDRRQLSPQQIAKSAIPSVAALTMHDAQGQPLSLGSGFFVDDSTIITNYHVVGGAVSGVARFLNSQQEHRLLGVLATDPQHDLALLKLAVARSVLRLAGDRLPEVGVSVYAVGSPEGLEGTFSHGVISSVRNLDRDTLLQITAPISPGSSGGPVLDDRGDVIGVATATFRDGQNLNFAVPSMYVKRLLRERGALQPFSLVKRGEPSYWLRFGQGGTSSLVGENFQWAGEFDFESGYSFSIRNKSTDNLDRVICLVIFYDRQGNPLEVDLVRYPNAVPAGLARRVASKVDPSIKRITTDRNSYRQYSFTPRTRLEYRILDYRVVP